MTKIASTLGFSASLMTVCPEIQVAIVEKVIETTEKPGSGTNAAPRLTQSSVEALAALLRVNRQIHAVTHFVIGNAPETQGLNSMRGAPQRFENLSDDAPDELKTQAREAADRFKKQAHYASAAHVLRLMKAYKEACLFDPQTRLGKFQGKLLGWQNPSYEDVLKKVKEDFATRSHICIATQSRAQDFGGDKPVLHPEGWRVSPWYHGEPSRQFTLMPREVLDMLDQLDEKTDLKSLRIDLGEFHEPISVASWIGWKGPLLEKEKLKEGVNWMGPLFKKLGEIKDRNPDLETVELTLDYRGTEAALFWNSELCQLEEAIKEWLDKLNCKDWLQLGGDRDLHEFRLEI